MIPSISLFQVLYPGYVGRQGLTDEEVGYHVGNLLSTLRRCFRSDKSSSAFVTRPKRKTKDASDASCAPQAKKLASMFLVKLPELRATLLDDVQAAFDGDPAARNLDEVILAYPGLLAVTVYRIAHELHLMGVPLMPRIMTEWAHGANRLRHSSGRRTSGKVFSSITRPASSSARRHTSDRT